MFGFTRTTPEITWKSIEGDFLLGACSRRIFGYATRGAQGSWSAFDDEARPLGVFADLAATKSALWRAHREGHDAVCAAPETRPRRGERTGATRTSDPERSRTAAARLTSW
ncbi:hypothetical protein [Microbacterium sp. B19]|uniref:hypothetical protein n=1 Tax=Microbacterium sp. B19 TaxID=96765 RepID=UPI0003491EBE|nr:hypothetical protein [Microbacterium sp. B19]